MKLLKILCIAFCLAGMAACSGSSGFSPEKCAQLEEKAKGSTPLTEGELNEMVDQLAAAFEIMFQKNEEFADDKKGFKEYLDSPEGKNVANVVFKFSVYLSQHESELSPEAIKKLEDLEKKYNNLSSR